MAGRRRPNSGVSHIGQPFEFTAATIQQITHSLSWSARGRRLQAVDATHVISELELALRRCLPIKNPPAPSGRPKREVEDLVLAVKRTILRIDALSLSAQTRLNANLLSNLISGTTFEKLTVFRKDAVDILRKLKSDVRRPGKAGRHVNQFRREVAIGVASILLNNGVPAAVHQTSVFANVLRAVLVQLEGNMKVPAVESLTPLLRLARAYVQRNLQPEDARNWFA